MHSLPSKSAAATLVLAAALTTPLAAQDPSLALPVPPALADALDLQGGTVQQLLLPSADWAPFSVAVTFAGRTWTLELQPYDMRADGFAVIEQDHGVERELPWTPTTYRGTVRGWSGSVVAGNLYKGQLDALVLTDQGTWAIQPATEGIGALPHSAHVVYRHDQVRQLPFRCGVQTTPGKSVQGGPLYAGALKTAELAAELEPRFRQIWGGGANAVNQATAILNGVDAIYQRDVSVTFKITKLLLRDAGYAGNNPNTILTSFRNTWNARALEIPRDVAHLFMGYPASGVIGISYVGSVCTSNDYSVSWHTSSLTSRTAVTAHEIGHSFNAQHCDGINPCWIMCSYIGGCSGGLTQFAPVSINVIAPFAAARPCLQ